MKKLDAADGDFTVTAAAAAEGRGSVIVREVSLCAGSVVAGCVPSSSARAQHGNGVCVWMTLKVAFT